MTCQLELLQGDARHIPLTDGSVHCCVTSPPYWGLRDYGLATWEGGDAECKHDAGSGTVGEVCQKHGRRFVGMDLSRPYLKLAEERLLKAPVGLL